MINNASLYNAGFLFLFLFLMSACSSDEERKKKIHGEWDGISWELDDADHAYDASQVFFMFTEQGNYIATLGNHSEAGTYRFRGNNLLTRAEGMSEMGVRIIRMDKDTMVLHMNRSGQLETLVLARKMAGE